ncbi:hypothetical protein KI387_026384, partial [Taxus chinensis]
SDNFQNLYFEGSYNGPRECTSEEGIKGVDNEGVIKLKGKKISRCLVSLEDLFDKYDKFIQGKAKDQPKNSAKFDQVNIETHEKPRLFNIGKCCSPEEKRSFATLLKKYSD